MISAQHMKRLVETMPEKRAARVEEVKKLVNSGSFMIDSHLIARKMIECARETRIFKGSRYMN